MVKNKCRKNEITKLEIGRLADLELVIGRGQKTFIEVGNALEEIRDERLYRESYQDFDEYCMAKWGWGYKRAHQLITSASVSKSLQNNKEISTMVDISNERQARELAKVEPERRAAVLEAISSSGGTITAKAIKNAAAASVDAVRMDSCKHEIPSKMLPTWDRADSEASEGMAMVSKLRTALAHAQESEDVIYREMNFSATITALNNAYSDFRRVKPYSVCYVCHGLRSEKCEACKGRGFYSKFFHEMCVPEEFK
jgi:hypothetical protein